MFIHSFIHSFIHKNIATLYLHFIDDASLILHINRNLRVVNPLSVLPSYKSQSIDLLCKSIDWFLYMRAILAPNRLSKFKEKSIPFTHQ